MSKIVVYTFAKGCVPRTFQPEDGIDYVAFTDGAAKAPWEIRPIEYKGSAYDANKYYKWHPHLLFADYDYAIYIDATIAIKNVKAFVSEIGAGSSSGINLAMHREHNVSEVELSKCRQFKKLDVSGNICATSYVHAHKSKCPVPETTVIIYDMKRLSVKALDEIWRQYCICAAHRDQLVVNYAFEKTGFHPLRQQTLPGYIPMGKYTYGIKYINYANVDEKKKDSRAVSQLPAVFITTPGNKAHPKCKPEYLSLLPAPTLNLQGWQTRGYHLNEHHVIPSQVQKWLPAIMKAIGAPYTEPSAEAKKMKFGPYEDSVMMPTTGHYTLYMDGKKMGEGGPEILSKPLIPQDAYHDLWWAKWEATVTVRDGEGPDVLLIANSMVLPLLPLLASVCHRLAYVDNRLQRNLDWINPKDYPHRAIIFDPNDNGQEHTALEAIALLARA